MLNFYKIGLKLQFFFLKAISGSQNELRKNTREKITAKGKRKKQKNFAGNELLHISNLKVLNKFNINKLFVHIISTLFNLFFSLNINIK